MKERERKIERVRTRERERKIERERMKERERKIERVKVREMKRCTDRSLYVLEDYDENAQGCSCHHVSHSYGG